MTRDVTSDLLGQLTVRYRQMTALINIYLYLLSPQTKYDDFKFVRIIIVRYKLLSPIPKFGPHLM